MSYRLLDTFRETFAGQAYLHRRSGLGDAIAVQIYEDLFALGRSTELQRRLENRTRVVNRQNRRRGVVARRGDGTFGEIVPNIQPVVEEGFAVARGPIATIEIGVEVKVVAKAMLKQIDRVIGDLEKQIGHFRRGGGSPICVGIVGLNWASQYTSYEGDRAYPTDGQRYPHPIREAPAAAARLLQQAQPAFDEFVLLQFRATNVHPFPFQWVSYADTEMDYGAALTRISLEYDSRFGS